MNIMNNQDGTPYDRMDDALLEQLLGTPRFPVQDGSEQRGGSLNCRGERVREDAVPTMACAMDGNHYSRVGFGVHGGTLAALYIPVQEFDDLYDEETALKQGTLFRGLDLPFRGGKGCK